MSSGPLYQRIKEKIRADLLRAQQQQQGGNQEGNGADAAVGDAAEAVSAARLPSERELQERYQVSRPTISKALAALAGEGFLVKEQRRGSFAVAASAATDRESTDSVAAAASPGLRQIGYVAPVAGEELVQRAFNGIDRIAHRRGYRVLMGNAGNEVARERQCVGDLVASGALGLVIMPIPRREDEARGDYLRTESLDIPLVLIDTCVTEQGHTQVIFDNRRLGWAMTNHLLGEGHRRIAHMTYVETILHGPLQARREGYEAALRDTGLALDPTLIRAFDTSLDHLQAQAAALEEWLSRPEPPTAIIAPDDFAAMEIIDLIEARGLRVPEDIRVTGFDNRSVARRFHPSFPTSSPDFERLGEIACDLLLDAIEATGDAAPRSYLLEAPLHIRRVETRRGAAVGTAAAKEGFRHRTSPVPALGGRK